MCEHAAGHVEPVPMPAAELDALELAAMRAAVEACDGNVAKAARRLGISERTLKAHVANIRAKAGHRGTETREGLHRALVVSEWL